MGRSGDRGRGRVRLLQAIELAMDSMTMFDRQIHNANIVGASCGSGIDLLRRWHVDAYRLFYPAAFFVAHEDGCSDTASCPRWAIPLGENECFFHINRETMAVPKPPRPTKVITQNIEAVGLVRSDVAQAYHKVMTRRVRSKHVLHLAERVSHLQVEMYFGKDQYHY